jgi:hypothetical protein
VGIDAKRGYRNDETKILGHFGFVRKQHDMLVFDTSKGKHELRTSSSTHCIGMLKYAAQMIKSATLMVMLIP